MHTITRVHAHIVAHIVFAYSSVSHPSVSAPSNASSAIVLCISLGFKRQRCSKNHDTSIEWPGLKKRPSMLLWSMPVTGSTLVVAVTNGQQRKVGQSNQLSKESLKIIMQQSQMHMRMHKNIPRTQVSMQAGKQAEMCIIGFFNVQSP